MADASAAAQLPPHKPEPHNPFADMRVFFCFVAMMAIFLFQQRLPQLIRRFMGDDPAPPQQQVAAAARQQQRQQKTS
jgi:hypothetical protein